jgi:hypothetical protein
VPSNTLRRVFLSSTTEKSRRRVKCSQIILNKCPSSVSPYFSSVETTQCQNLCGHQTNTHLTDSLYCSDLTGEEHAKFDDIRILLHKKNTYRWFNRVL